MARTVSLDVAHAGEEGLHPNGNGAPSLDRQLAATPKAAGSAPAIELATKSLRLNTWLGLVVRILLGAMGLVSGALAIVYSWRHAESLAAADLTTSDLVLLVPVVVLVLLAGFAGSAAWLLHSRELEETSRALDAINRIQRETEVAVSARGLIYAFEEKLNDTRRAFNLLLWLGRSIFVVCLGLFSAAVVNAIVNGVDLTTAVLGTASIAGMLLSVAKRVPQSVSRQLAQVIEIQTIVTGCDRQISLLESVAFAALQSGETTAGAVLETQARIDHVVERAVARIHETGDARDTAA
jgi:hypothetical protein